MSQDNFRFSGTGRHRPEESATPSETSGTEARSMVFDGRMLIVASLTNSALGAVYWLVAARLYPTHDVGIASTTINTALTLATISNLALGTVVERLIPVAGRLQMKLVAVVQGCTLCLAVALAGLFMWLGPDEQLFTDTWERVTFMVAVPVLTQYTIQDSILIALRHGWVSALRNVLHAVVKLTLIIVLAASSASTGIVLSWIVPSLVAVVVAQTALVTAGNLLRKDRNRESQLPPVRRITGFNLMATVWMVVQALPGLVVPVIVLQHDSGTTAAYFNLSWTVVTASTVLISAVAGPYVSNSARSPAQLATLTRKFIRMYMRLSALRALMVAVGGPVLMWIYGTDYARGATPMLLLVALGQVISTSAFIYGNLERVNGRIGYSALLQGVGAMVLISAASFLIPSHGLLGAGIAYLLHDIYLAVASAPRARKLIRSMRNGVLPDNHLQA